MATRTFIFIAALAALAQAETLDFRSEFQRIDPFGNVVAADRAWRPREILSPAVARNAYAAFHLVVSVPPRESYFLYVGANPEKACGLRLYREHFVKTSRGWVPDRLVEVTQQPDFGTMPDPEDNIEGQTTRVYLVELWIPPDAPVGRFRVEAQLKVAGWTIRPMEVRVASARVPDLPHPRQAPALPPVEQGADASALRAVDGYLAGRPLATDPQPMTVRGVIRRDAVQDMALAASPAELTRRVFDLFAINARFSPRPLGAEWYLKVRDWLYSR